MGQYFQKMGIIFFSCILFSCGTKEISHYEYIFFTYERGIPQYYTIILQEKRGDVIRRVYFSGDINRGWYAVPGYFPDTAVAGFSKFGGFGYSRLNHHFEKTTFRIDTLTKCHFWRQPILINSDDKNKNLLDDIEGPDDYVYHLGSCLDLNYIGKDTVFNNLGLVKKFKKYRLYDCVNGELFASYFDFVIDFERYIIIHLFFKSELAHDYIYEIVNSRKITEEYFYEMWDKAEEVNYFDCSPF